MRVTTKGQVTIPKHIREHLNIEPHSEVDFLIDGERVVLLQANSGTKREVSRFRRVRGLLKGGPTTEEWMKATRGD